ncbi:hypothetical protein ACU4GH_18625 [Bradyrhizobium betae]
MVTLLSFGSPFSSASEKFLACCSVICGGSGGTSGSVFTSSTTGISHPSACSQAEASRFGTVDEDAPQAYQLGEAGIGDVGNALRGLEFGIAVDDALLPGHLR